MACFAIRNLFGMLARVDSMLICPRGMIYPARERRGASPPALHHHHRKHHHDDCPRAVVSKSSITIVTVFTSILALILVTILITITIPVLVNILVNIITISFIVNILPLIVMMTQASARSDIPSIP